MKRFKILVAALGVSLVAMLALAPVAQAQQAPGQAIGDPLFVDAAGEATITLTGSGWIPGQLALVGCNASNYEELVAGGSDDCDLGSLQFAEADADGNFTADYTLEIDADGRCIGIGAGAGFAEQGGGFCVGVGAPIAPPGVANTGAESGMIVVIGIAVLAAGALVVGMTRRRAFVS
tara:strand:+ start:1960 stop:2490 length:531 start_codon:yes stop_codon:yes gene_type:complete